MGFDRRDIRPTMDVYTLDNAYLGTVLAIIPGREPSPEESAPAPGREASTISGESLGPMPTQPVGNVGPETQSARAGYAAHPDGAERLGRGALTVGKWWGLAARRTIPLDAVQTVSLERVVLKLKRDELPAWERGSVGAWSVGAWSVGVLAMSRRPWGVSP